MAEQNPAPGYPGIPATWTSSAKSGVGTALNPSSRVWFTLSHGIFDEIYYPRVDQACTRDLGMLVADGNEFFSEEKRHTRQQVEFLAAGVPAYRLINTCDQGRYRIQKDILSDPNRDVVLQKTTFLPLLGKLADFHLYAILAPHLGNQGGGNTAWVGDYKGWPMLFAERDQLALALACSTPWLNRSAGYVGFSDGWQDLNQHKTMTWMYDRAENGNVALTGEVNLSATDGQFTLAVGFGTSAVEAGQRALASLQDGFESGRREYIREWQGWQASLRPLNLSPDVSTDDSLYRTSMAVLRTHESKHNPGGLIASLSIPWGFAKGDGDLGGYHLAWPRDLVESAGGLLAGGAHDDARRVLFFLQVTQEADGHWPQNMWLDGNPYWQGIQMDETALPILLVDLARREKALQEADLTRLWPMVKKAAGFLACYGPVSPQDRWEEDPGYSPFTLAAETAALVAAADLAERFKENKIASYLREIADYWYTNIDRWIYYRQTDLAQKYGADGYYVRVAPPDAAEAASPQGGFVPIKNRPPGENFEPASQIISPDALALVRFGLRRPDDPRIRDTLKVIDALLKVDMPNGPAWRRYNEDGYGEHEDGSPFDGVGIGRAWPLLTGERGHYEVAAGHLDEAAALLRAMETFTDEARLLPEQVWDQAPIAEAELYPGKPSGSAMPLVWAHAEYVKLHRSIRDQHVFDLPPQTAKRYLQGVIKSPLAVWRGHHKIRSFPAGKTLRIELLTPGTVRWSIDQWQTESTAALSDTRLGIFTTDLPTVNLPVNSRVEFQFVLSRTDIQDLTRYQVMVSSE